MQKQSFTSLKKSTLGLLISIVLFSVFKCEDHSDSLLEESLTHKEIYQLRIMSQEAFKQMPEAEDWESLMQTYQHSPLQEVLALIYVKKDILYKLGHTSLSAKEFGQNLRRYEDTCDEIDRIIASLTYDVNSAKIPAFFLSSYPLNYPMEAKRIAQNP